MLVRSLLVSALLTSSIASAAPVEPRPATVIRPTVDELHRALARRDTVELERLARRMGAPRLCALIERGSADAREAALAAIVLIDEGLQLVPRLLAFAGRADTPVAVAQATLEAVQHMSERTTRGEVDLDELPGDLPRAAVESLTTFAAREERPTALRVSAVYALGALTPLVPSAQGLVQLVTSKDVDVRRAVADALPVTAAPTLTKLLTDDGNATVAAAAADTLCRDVPPPGFERKNDKALKRVVELPTAARVRLRTLATDATLDEGSRLDVLPCLRPSAQRAEERKADLDTLVAIEHGPDGSLKRRARQFGAR